MTRPVALRLAGVGLLLLGLLGGYWLGAHDARPAEARACTVGLKLANDTSTRFDEKKALEDVKALNQLTIKDPGVRREAEEIVTRFPSALRADDSDDQIADLLAALERACQNWLSR